ncbi:MAG: glycosyltransferase [Desulfosoma sp.]
MKAIIGLVLNYRDPVRTTRCVQSLLEGGTKGVWVWDNSEDEGASYASLKQEWAGCERVWIFQSPCNLGFAMGVNCAMEAILDRHPDVWIMLINDDAVLHKGALLRLAKALSETDYPLAYPQIKQGRDTIGIVFYQRHFALLTFNKHLPGSFGYPTGCALLIAPERIALPLFDEDFFMYGEDVMLGWRLGVENMVYVPDAVVFHEGRPATEAGSVFYEARVVAGHWILARKLARNTLEHKLLVAGRCLSLTARALLRSISRGSLRPILGFLQGAKLARGQDPALRRARQVSAALRCR